MSKEFVKKLPSGAELKFNLAPFADAKDLYQAVVAESKNIQFNSKREFVEVWKDLAVAALSSKVIEDCVMGVVHFCWERNLSSCCIWYSLSR